jgi:mannan endo-1,4-beta-mannosidase
MNAVFFFSNNWEWSGGFLQYLAWNGRLGWYIAEKKLNWDDYRDYVSRFYSCDACMEAYWTYVRTVLRRTNSITGRKYTDDPAIMAWEVANEPRPMRPAADSAYTVFLRSSTALIKSIDKKHLVTLGTEGVMGTESADLYEAVHRDNNVDYCTIHIWPKNWGWFKGTAIADSINSIISRGDEYIRSHEAIAARIGKPLVIEEFGLPRDGHLFDTGTTTVLRDKWFAAVFARLDDSRQSGGTVAGVSFWAFAGEGRPVPGQVAWKEEDDLLGDPPMEEQGLNAIFDCDSSTWKLITSFTKKINSAYVPKGKQ